jgi:hypothetical protein
MDKTIFFTLVRSIGERQAANLLIDSLRNFGGDLSRSPFWVFEADPERAPCGDLVQVGAQVIELQVPGSLKNYLFAGKVSACAQAETLAAAEVNSLVWLNAGCLIVQPPLDFELGESFDLAVRPVHIRNIGQPVTAPIDAFWQRIYAEVELQDHRFSVESFVDGQRLRAYFNSHLLSINPSMSLFRRWLTHFEALVLDQEFQSGPCQDELHQIFLHQAILSALIAASIDPQRIHILPPGYSYPYHLHQDVPPDRRAKSLNELTCVAYEDLPLDPNQIKDIQIHEPLRSWLLEHKEKL